MVPVDAAAPGLCRFEEHPDTSSNPATTRHAIADILVIEADSFISCLFGAKRPVSYFTPILICLVVVQSRQRMQSAPFISATGSISVGQILLHAPQSLHLE